MCFPLSDDETPERTEGEQTTFSGRNVNDALVSLSVSFRSGFDVETRDLVAGDDDEALEASKSWRYIAGGHRATIVMRPSSIQGC